jgi:hypothetical protein
VVARSRKSVGKIQEDLSVIKGKVTLEKNDAGKITGGVWKTTKTAFKTVGKLLETYLKQEKFTGGTTADRLATRSGLLKASVKAVVVSETPQGIEGGVAFGTVYSRPHIGPKGQVTTIKPKKGKYLTIPLDAAKTPAGVARGSAMFGPWGDTFVAKTKSGNLIIFGRKKMYKDVKVGGTRVKGLSVMKMGRDVVPLFLLKKEVKIPARIHPEDIVGWIAPKLIKEFKDKGIEVT